VIQEKEQQIAKVLLENNCPLWAVELEATHLQQRFADWDSFLGEVPAPYRRDCSYHWIHYRSHLYYIHVGLLLSSSSSYHAEIDQDSTDSPVGLKDVAVAVERPIATASSVDDV
jgi:hypothetical protein